MNLRCPLAVESVAFDKGSVSLVRGNEVQLVYVTAPAGSYDRTVAWSSADETVATVDATGKVLGVYQGEGSKSTTVTVKLGSGEGAKEATITVEVFGEEVHAGSVELASTATVYVGKTLQLTATTTPAMVSDVAQWSSDNQEVATVSDKGLVSGLKAGTANITVRYNETAFATCAVTVSIEPGTDAEHPLDVAAAIEVGSGLAHNTETETEYYVKGIISQIVSNDFGTDFDNGTFWLANGETVAQGFEGYRCKLATGVSADNFKVGSEAVIRCKIKKYSSTIETGSVAQIVSLTYADRPATAIALDKTSLEMDVLDEVLVKATLTPVYSTDTVTWLTTDAAVATVANGKVTAVGAGNATITAKVSDTLSATCAVKVNAAEEETFKEALFGTSNNSEEIASYTSNWYSTNKGFRVDIVNANNNRNGWNGAIAFGSKNAASVGSVTTHAAIESPIEKVIVNITQAKVPESINSIKLYKSEDGTAWTEVGAFTYATGAQEVAIAAPKGNLYYKVVFDCAQASANGNCRIDSIKYMYGEEASTPEPTVVPLPIIAKGNQDTKVEGAGAWIYIDTTGLTLTPEMATAMLAVAEINLTVSMSDETPDAVKDAAQHYITGADAAVVLDQANIRLDDYGTNSVRLYIGMDKGLANDWMMKHEFEISIPLDANTVLEGSVEFVGGSLRKINGEAYVAPVVIAQPTGTFFATPELTAGGQISIMVILGAGNSIDLRVNGTAVSDAVITSFDSSTGEMVVTTNAYGRIKVTYNPESGLLEGLSLLDASSLLKYDGYVNMYGNEKLKYWDCDGTTEELQAQFVRRYGSPWNNDTGNADRVVKDETNFKFGSGAKVRAWGDGRIALAVKQFDSTFNGRNLSFWVYNPGSSDISLQAFGYKATNFGSYFQIFDGKKALAGQWTYISVGFSAADMYNFQIVVPNGTTTQLTFDDICLF